MAIHKKRTTLALVLLAALALSSTVAAQSPQTLSYQGRLTDDTGVPLDAVVDLTFRLYPIASGGSPVWTQMHSDVVVTDGLFDVVLELHGSDMGDAFDGTVRFMSVQVGDGPESDVRTRIGMVPYAWWSRQCDSARVAGGGSGISEGDADDRYVNVDGDAMTGDLLFDSDSDPETALITGVIAVQSDATDIKLYDNADPTAWMWGDDYGEVALYYRGESTPGVDLSAFATGGSIMVWDSTGTNTITLEGSGSGDNALQVPDGAVHSEEVLNETGLVASINQDIFLLNGVMQDLETVTITTPAAGYILVIGRCWGRTRYTSGSEAAYGYIQIDETSGGSEQYPHYAKFGIDNPTDGTRVSMPVYIDRIYFKAAGTHTFRLEGRYPVVADVVATLHTGDHQLTAIYLPTSYGTVEEIVSEPGDHPDAIPLAAGERPFGETSVEQYKVDLRYYELKAKAAREAALEAERELEDARARNRVER